MLKQIKDANMTVGYVGGWCLKYVQDAFGTDHPYPTAISAWNNNYGNGNHPNELPPLGKTVPVYFTLGTEPAGHVAISLDDGMVASSTQSGSHPRPYIHKNLNDLIAIYGKYNGGCTYLGWSEFVGTRRVVEYVADNATADQINKAYIEILERSADPGALVHYSVYTLAFVHQDLLNSNERKTLLANKQAQADAIALQAKIAKDVLEAKLKAEAQAASDAVIAQAIKDKAIADQAKIDADNISNSTHKLDEIVEQVKANDEKLSIIMAIVQWIKDTLSRIFK